MIYNFNFEYKDLNELSYQKECYDDASLLLYIDGIYKLEIAIFIDNTSDEDLEYIILNDNKIYLNQIKAMDLKGNKVAFTSHLCRCNKCDSILLDRNPQITALKHNIYIDSEKKFVNENSVRVLEMDYLKVFEANEYFWACPKCQSDDYLTDM